VVVLAFNRPAALRRLLDSVSRGQYPNHTVSLVISIDSGGDEEVVRVAESFKWLHGEKTVVVAERHLGLVDHFHQAGDLAEKYGSIILLEDDLLVSPAYYLWASGALQSYNDDDRIAGVSLCALWFNGYNHLPFVPILDTGDVFFLQVPYYLGQAFTGPQWRRYADWRSAGNPRPTPTDSLHPLVSTLGADEWFPDRLKYLAVSGRYHVFPRASVCTGFGDAGTHFTRPSRWLQTPLQSSSRAWSFLPLGDSLAVYDGFFEMLPDRLARLAEDPELAQCDIDLYGTKPRHVIRREKVLTSRRSSAPLRGWVRHLWPHEANIAQGIAGNDILLTLVGDVRRGWLEDLRLQAELQTYFGRGKALSWRRALGLSLLRRLLRLFAR
jgi:hypothetical protein